MLPMHGRKAEEAFPEQWEPPPGFALRQSSGALAMEASQPKAPAAVAPKRRYGAPRWREDWRSPRRYRAIHRFMVSMHAKKRKTVSHEPGLVWSPAFRLCARGPDHLKSGLITKPAAQQKNCGACR